MEWVPTFVNAIILMGACDPYGLNRQAKHKQVVNIIKFAENNQQDSYELLAIALIESSLKPRAYSHTRDSGLFQVNCKWWRKSLKYKTIRECEKDMFNPEVSVKAGSHILNHYRNKYKHCKGELAYRCYNGGPGWPRSKNKMKIINYQKKVTQRKKNLYKYYKDLIEQIRSQVRTRS
jgi:soluble lytic murein transglycosylase-like protein